MIDLVKRYLDIIVEECKGNVDGRDVSVGMASEAVHMLLSAGDTHGHLNHMKSMHSLVFPNTPFSYKVVFITIVYTLCVFV